MLTGHATVVEILLLLSGDHLLINETCSPLKKNIEASPWLISVAATSFISFLGTYLLNIYQLVRCLRMVVTRLAKKNKTNNLTRYLFIFYFILVSFHKVCKTLLSAHSQGNNQEFYFILHFSKY